MLQVMKLIVEANVLILVGILKLPENYIENWEYSCG